MTFCFFQLGRAAPTRIERLSDYYLVSSSRHIDLPAEGMGRNNPHKNATGLTENYDATLERKRKERINHSAYNLPNVDVHGTFAVVAVVFVVYPVIQWALGQATMMRLLLLAAVVLAKQEYGECHLYRSAVIAPNGSPPPPAGRSRPSQGSPETQSPSRRVARAVRRRLLRAMLNDYRRVYAAGTLYARSMRKPLCQHSREPHLGPRGDPRCTPWAATPC